MYDSKIIGEEGRAESTVPGEEELWYVLRVTYCRELKLQERLRNKGFETFIPMKAVREEKKGRVVRKLVPAVSNMVFVHARRSSIEDYFLSEGDARMTYFMWDKASRMPIVVPDKQMADFITVCTRSSDDVLYLSTISDKLRNGVRVIVRSGPFSGVEGTVVRIRKSRRILVEIPDVLSAVSTYVPMEDLEVAEDNAFFADSNE